ncbi:MAG: DUF4249 family protein [Draconibacterium sp.]|nr:DUF4249 family protein [Draconibacterium sp.]
MKKYIQLTLFIIVIATFVSCEDEVIYTPDERFVLQAYLYANEPVWDVSIRNAVPLSVTDSVGAPINDAIITLYKNDIAYTLISSSDTGTYHYPGDDLIIETGDNFSIEANVGEKTATGITSVPESPEEVIMSDYLIELPEIRVDPYTGRPDFGAMQAIMSVQREIQLEVLWNNPDGELYFIVIENAEDNQESIFPDFGGKFGSAGKGSFRKITLPTRESSHEINFMEMQYWGKYVVKVYRINKEYADLYDNLEQDSRDLNEPPTNIKNGLGIFSAFNSQNIYFDVVKE